MSDTARDQDLLAAEYALGLLDGDELRQAQRLLLADPAFAEAVRAWEERLAPLAEEAGEEEPGPRAWENIRQAIAAQPPAAEKVVALRRRLGIWRGYGAAMTALAASLALVVGYQATRDEPIVVQPQQRAPVMVATLSSDEAETSLSVAYDKQRGSLLVTPGRMSGAPGHDHELWIIPAGGSPISLGLVRADAPHRLPVPAQLAPHFRDRAAIALSVEPEGGSPTGQPTGPVVASGELATI